MDWPFQEFDEYLNGLMREAGIPDTAELSRLSGVSQTQFSNWRHGRSRPSRDSLRKVAQVLDIPVVKLFYAAALVDEEELKDHTPDLRLLPIEIRELVDLYGHTDRSDEQRRDIRRSVAILVAGLRAELDTSEIGPSSRRHIS